MLNQPVIITVAVILLVLGSGAAIFARQTLYLWFRLTLKVFSFLPDIKMVYKEMGDSQQMVYASPIFKYGIWAWRLGGLILAVIGGYLIYSAGLTVT